MELKYKIFWGVWSFVIVLLIFLLGFIIGQNGLISEMNSGTISNSEQEIINNCENLSLVDSAYCLNKEIKKIFVYNISNQEIDISEMSFEKLLNEGGTCKHWNNLIERLARELNFSSKHITLLPNIKHGFSVIYDSQENDFCVLDQDDLLGCKKLEDSNE